MDDVRNSSHLRFEVCRGKGDIFSRLQSNDPTLTSFRIPSALNDADAIRFADAMRNNTCVRHVTIKMCDTIGGHGLTRIGVQHLATGIVCRPLQELQVISWEDHANHMADPHVRELLPVAMDILYQAIAHSSTLQRLDIMCVHEVNVHSLCHILKQNHQLQSFAFAVRDDLSISSARHLARAIRESRCLREVEIHGQSHWTMFGVVHAMLDNPALWNVLLVEGIGASPTIQTLSLQRGGFGMTNVLQGILTRDQSIIITKIHMNDNVLTNRSMQEFVQQWQQQQPLHPFQELDFCSNSIGTDGVHYLLQAMTTTATPGALKTLRLQGNKQIGYAGLQSIGEALLLIHQVQLQQLDLRGCVFSSEPVAARDKAAQALVQGVQRNVHVQSLNIQHNCFPTCVEEEIDFYCALNRHGRYLLSTNHGLASTIWCHVLAKCGQPQPQQQQQHHCASLMYYFLIEQPGLVPARW